MTTGNIKLTRFLSEAVDTGDKHVWPLVVVAEGINMPEDIFVYQVSSSMDPIEGDIFRTVASVHDLYELPKNGAVALTGNDEGDNLPFYRTNKATVFCRNAKEAEKVWEMIQADTQDLVKNYFSDLRLKAVDSAVISEDSIEHNDMKDFKQYMVTISYLPAGEATINGNEQGINNPDPTRPGWLPISEVPSSFVDPVPPGAVYFYNIAKDENLSPLFPLKEPYNIHLFHYNGSKVTYGTIYKITRDTIYWMPFDPGDFHFTNVSISAGSAPWPMDYIYESNPGVNPPSYSLLIFADE